MKLTEKTPHELADYTLVLADEYGKIGEELCNIQEMKAELYPLLRETCKSIAESDRMWEVSPEGLKEKTLRMKLKVKEKKMSAIKALLNVRNNEIYNQY